MFTGIVEQVGRLGEVKQMAGGYRVRIETPLAGEPLRAVLFGKVMAA